MKLKYQVTITGIGELAEDMMAGNIMILFDDNAPAELQEISVVHTISELLEPVQINDTFVIAEKKFEVIAVGDEANRTFKDLGHCTLKFCEEPNLELPGQIVLKGGQPPDVKIGDMISVF